MIPQFIPYWGEAEKKAVADVLDSDYLNEYKTVREFERKFADFVGAKYCVLVPSGTMALYTALCSIGIAKEFCIIPDHDGIFAHNAARAVRALPVLRDVNSRGVTEMTEYTGVVVHANGRVAENIPSVEDCSQAVNYHTKNRISTYSFASTKHITTGGQGGAVCCDDEEVFTKLVRVKDHGRQDRQNLKPMGDSYPHWGINLKFTEMQAAFGLSQLEQLPKRLERLKEICKIYYDIIGDDYSPSEYPQWYVDIFVNNPEKIKEILSAKGIGVRRYPKPLHMQPVYKGKGEFPTATRRYERGLYLPSTTNLSDEQVKEIAGAVVSAIKQV